MTDIAFLPATPTAAPPASSDMALLTRPPQQTDPIGTAASGFAVPFGSLAPAILPKEIVTAGGTSLSTATALTRPVSIVSGAIAGGGVCLRGIAHDTQVVLNSSPNVVLVYPPKSPPGSINGQGLGAPVQISGGAQVEFHSEDGVAYFAGV